MARKGSDGETAVGLETPFGPMVVLGTEKAVTGAGFVPEPVPPTGDPPAPLRRAVGQLEEYFRGERRVFDLDLNTHGTAFQTAVWEQLRLIPFGETRTYGELARAIGRPGAARAVGGACRSNPLGVIVPCHRVIGHDGRLVGFGGPARDLGLKRRLIEHEREVSKARPEGPGEG